MVGNLMSVGRSRKVGVFALVAAMLLAAFVTMSGTAKAGAASSKTVSVGMLGVSSGPEVVFEGLQQGYDDYLKMVNANGGVNGYKFKVTDYNTQFSTTGEVLGTKQFINSKQFLIAGSESSAPTEIAQLVNAAKVPLIGFSADPVLITNPSSKWTMAANIDYTSIGAFEVQQLVKLGFKQIGFVYIGISTGIDVLAGAQNEALKLGATLDPIEIPFTQTDFTPVAQRLQADGDTASVMLMLDTQAGNLEAAASTAGYHPQWWLEQAGVDNTFLSGAGAAANGTIADMNVDLPAATSVAYTTFKSTLTNDGDASAVSPLGEQGWTNAAITVQGIKNATAGGKKLTQAGFLAAMTHLNQKGAVGFATGIKDSPSQRSLYSGSYIYKVENGAWTSTNVLNKVPASLHLNS